MASNNSNDNSKKRNISPSPTNRPKKYLKSMAYNPSPGYYSGTQMNPNSNIVTSGLAHNTNYINSASINGSASNNTGVNGSMKSNIAINLTPNLKLQEMVREIEPRFSLAPGVEELLLDMVNEFAMDVVQLSSKLAQHRNSKLLEPRDLQFTLQKQFNGLSFPMTSAGGSNPPVGSKNSMRVNSYNSSVLAIKPRPSKASIHSQRILLKKKMKFNDGGVGKNSVLSTSPPGQMKGKNVYKTYTPKANRK